MRLILIITLMFLNILIRAQDTTCNRKVWIKNFTKLLPKEVCIPEGNYQITQVYKPVDLNGDGLNDFVFDWNKYPLNDGDTIYITIYKQNPDSTFSFFRTFSNVYPIYFERYDWDYNPKKNGLINLLKKYNDGYPLINLTFEKETIKITMHNDAESELTVTYRFDKKLSNWIYCNSEVYYYRINEHQSQDLSSKLGPTIDNFTYFIWDE